MKLVASIPPDNKWTTEVHVKTTDGQIFSSHTDMPKGDVFKNPLTKEEIYTKYRDNVAFSKTFPIINAEKALLAMEKLEELNNVKELTDLFIRG
jgi:hypothetical protein